MQYESRYCLSTTNFLSVQCPTCEYRTTSTLRVSNSEGFDPSLESRKDLHYVEFPSAIPLTLAKLKLQERTLGACKLKQSETNAKLVLLPHRLSIAYWYPVCTAFCSPWKSWPSKCKVLSVATVLFGFPCLRLAWHFKHVPFSLLHQLRLCFHRPESRLCFPWQEKLAQPEFGALWPFRLNSHGVMEGCSEQVKPVAALETSRLKILFVFPQDFPGSLKHPGRLLRAMRNSRHLVVPRVQDRAVSTNSPEVRRQASRRSVRCV